jgi:tetratricopeptide (TPR) repeat protein
MIYKPVLLVLCVVCQSYVYGSSNANTDVAGNDVLTTLQVLPMLKHNNTLGEDNHESNEYFIKIDKHLYGIKYESALKLLINVNPHFMKDDSFRVRYFLTFSKLWELVGSYNLAIEYQKKIIPICSSNYERYLAYSLIGEFYLRLNSVDSSLFYYKKQYNISLISGNAILKASALNNQGLAEYEIGDFQQALLLFKQALKCNSSETSVKDKQDDAEGKNFHYSIIENIGKCQYHLGYIMEAKLSLESSMNHSAVFSYRNAETLLRVYLVQNNIAKAQQLIANFKTDGSIVSTEAKIIFTNMKLLLALKTNEFNTIEQLYSDLQNLQSINLKAQSVRENLLSLMISEFLIDQGSAVIAVERTKKNNSIQQLNIVKQQKTTYLFVLLFVLFAVFIGILLIVQYYRINKQKIEVEKEKYKLKNEQQKFKIKFQELALTDYALDFTKTKNHERTIIDSLNSIANKKVENISSEINTLIAELKQQHLIDIRAEKLALDSHVIVLELKHKLKNKHSDLNNGDIELCLLIRLGLSNKEIATLKRISADSIKTIKNRLKNKLKLTKEETLSDYLNLIS